MGIIQHFDQNKGVAFIVWDGAVTAEQWFIAANNLVSNPAWMQIPRVLADLQSVVDTSTIGDAEIARAVEILSADPAPLMGKRLAMIARDAFGKARHCGQLLARFGVSSVVFNNLDTACLFLGLEALEAHKVFEGIRQQLNRA
jgi:hypothetical protein